MRKLTSVKGQVGLVKMSTKEADPVAPDPPVRSPALSASGITAGSYLQE